MSKRLMPVVETHRHALFAKSLLTSHPIHFAERAVQGLTMLCMCIPRHDNQQSCRSVSCCASLIAHQGAMWGVVSPGGGGLPGGFWVANSMKWGCGLMVSCSSGTNSCLLSSSNLQQQQPCMLSKNNNNNKVANSIKNNQGNK